MDEVFGQNVLGNVVEHYSKTIVGGFEHFYAKVFFELRVVILERSRGPRFVNRLVVVNPYRNSSGYLQNGMANDLVEGFAHQLDVIGVYV